jgi:hypothetical protein
VVVTERGRSIATISPVEAPADIGWVHQLVAEGRPRWNGGMLTTRLNVAHACDEALLHTDAIAVARFLEEQLEKGGRTAIQKISLNAEMLGFA